MEKKTNGASSENMPDVKISDFVIVIGRQYGAGGRRIGRSLAEALGVPYYDKELLAEAAHRLGYNPDIFIKRDERRPSGLSSAFCFAYGTLTSGFDQLAMSPEMIYQYQSRVIKEICNRESCVMVGRTADYVMRNHPGLLSLFVNSPLEERARAIMARGEADTMKAASELAGRCDRDREGYYNYFTNRRGWGKADNYHLTVNSSEIPVEAIVEVVRRVLTYRNSQKHSN